MAKMVIRPNCFETNSSSDHAFCITTQDEHVTFAELSGEVKSREWLWVYKHEMHLDVRDGYQREPFQILHTFKDKLQYAMCEYLGYSYFDNDEDNKKYDDFLTLVTSLDPKVHDFSIGTKIEEIYLDKDGNRIPHKHLIYAGYDAEKEEWQYNYMDKDGNEYPAVLDKDNYDEIPDIGCIDHQSAGRLRCFLKEKGISLKEFLTNKKYIIVVDSDELNDWDDYVELGVIDMNFIKEIYR